jgi:hypothetical protein
MKKTKVLPFSVVKISFLLFLAYVGSAYMQTEAREVLWWECELERMPGNGGSSISERN